jgi:hypothetical protein
MVEKEEGCTLETIFHVCIPKKDLASLLVSTKYFQNRIIMFWNYDILEKSTVINAAIQLSA